MVAFRISSVGHSRLVKFPRICRFGGLARATARRSYARALTLNDAIEIIKHSDQMIAPTVSIPLVTTLALFWEKAGINQDVALDLLCEALTEAMDDGLDDNHVIRQRIEQVETAIKAVKNDLIAQLPKMPRTGKVVTDNLVVELVPAHDAVAVA